MRAAIRTRYGPPTQLTVEALEAPTLGPGEILVANHAATVNRTDCAILLAQPFVMRLATGLLKPRDLTPGTDFAGVIEAVAPDVEGFAVGDRVWGFNDMGLASHATHLVLSIDEAILPIPEGISFEDAAASAEGAHYAYYFINKVELEAGQRAMVNGGTGAIGSALIQLLAHAQIEVVATCRGEHAEQVKALGASRIIDYTQADFTQDAERFDYVFDAVGKSTFGRCKGLLVEGGVYISSELGPKIQNPFLALLTRFIGRRKVRFPFPGSIKESLGFIQGLLEAGRFKPLIDRAYTLDEIREAYERAEAGEKVGNLLLKP